MKLEINVISTEVVTPSSPTPPHLNTYMLSFIDRLMPPLLMPLILFYPHNSQTLTSNSERSNHLKKSLSKTLNLYYPLAGRLVDNSYVNCNDEGVTYVEARANHNLFDVITNPLIIENLNKFVPCDAADGGNLCLVVQVTFFSCGGLAIGSGLSHRLFDAFSCIMFVNSWAAFSSGDVSIQSPIFESAILFPPEDLVMENKNNGPVIKENLVTKMFVFSPQKISELRDKYTNSNTIDDKGLIRPTRIEALSAFIWTRMMVATVTKDDDIADVYGLKFAVDFRKRVVPPLSEYHFGNMIVGIEISMPPHENNICVIVKKTREAISDLNGDSLTTISMKSEAIICMFSSLCGLPLNKADFGWGIPICMKVGFVQLKNLVFFTNSLSGGGIDACVTMKEEDMTKFEADVEILAATRNQVDIVGSNIVRQI